MNIFPLTVSAKDIQRNYRKVFEKVKKTKEPVIVLTNNLPDVAILDVEQLNRLYENVERSEIIQTLKVIDDYKKEIRAKKLKKLKSLKNLM